MTSNQSIKRLISVLDDIASNYPSYPRIQEFVKNYGFGEEEIEYLFNSAFGITVKKYIKYLVYLRARHTLRTDSTSFIADSIVANHTTITPISSSEAVHLNYNIIETKFGTMLIAGTLEGLSAVLFLDDTTCKLSESELDKLITFRLAEYYPGCRVTPGVTPAMNDAQAWLGGDEARKLTLHIRATPFMMDVYKALLMIPSSQLRTYTEIARYIGRPKASRAVGSAVARNPISLIIPCHRVVPAANTYGNYRWGKGRKTALLVWEAIQEEQIA